MSRAARFFRPICSATTRAASSSRARRDPASSSSAGNPSPQGWCSEVEATGGRGCPRRRASRRPAGASLGGRNFRYRRSAARSRRWCGPRAVRRRAGRSPSTGRGRGPSVRSRPLRPRSIQVRTVARSSSGASAISAISSNASLARTRIALARTSLAKNGLFSYRTASSQPVPLMTSTSQMKRSYS